MRNSIASYKESLSRIANEVLDAAQAEAREKNPFSGNRIFQQTLRPTLSQSFPHANGNDSSYIDEIAKYRADVQKLQASESEIKALSFNYAALLKEKEEQLHDLVQENLLLRKSLEARKDNGSLASDESPSSPSNDSITPKGREKLLEEVKALKVVQAGHQFDMMLLKEQLDKERANVSQLKIQLHEEYQLKEASQRELRARDIEKNSNTEDLQEELDRNLSELKRLQEEVNRKDLKYDESMESLNSEMHRLKKEKTEAMAKKNELEEKLNYLLNNKPEKNDAGSSDLLDASKNESKELASKIREFEEALNEAYKERDKALQELSRLKQHLLDKELEDEDKMDEDYKIIEELRTMTEFQRVQILQLDKTLLLERTKGEDLQEQKSDEVHQLNDVIKGLKQKVTNLMSINDAKNVELQNLQTALGQYYAESEAKERFVNELTVAREESTKYSKLLNVANQFLETSKRENEETNARLLQTERILSESKDSLRKLEEDNSKLRHALERSMTALNRMSLDSDNYVDRRIVIKLLVTYFQRNHSREVLDLMIRMLGFSEEDKQRIGFAQHSVVKKGVVRGVLGLPGRLVGGILGGNSDSASSLSSENQSFSDLWVDFLLKEAEEREKRESSEDGQRYSVEQNSTARGFVAPSSPTAQNPSRQRNSYN